MIGDVNSLSWPHLVVVLIIVASFVLFLSAIVSIAKAGKPTTETVLWILATIFIPVVGPILWFAIGKRIAPQAPRPDGGAAGEINRPSDPARDRRLVPCGRAVPRGPGSPTAVVPTKREWCTGCVRWEVAQSAGRSAVKKSWSPRPITRRR